MSKKHLENALLDPSSQIQRSRNNLLGRVYWSLISRLGITPASFISSLNKFIRDPNNVPDQTARKRSERMSNITAELTNPERMSWNKFIEGLKAAEIIRIRIRFEVWRGKRKIHAETIVDANLCEISTEEHSDRDKD